MEEPQVRPRPSKGKRLLTFLLLSIIIAVAGIYVISGSPRLRVLPKQYTNIE
jgi:hypothetical protein